MGDKRGPEPAPGPVADDGTTAVLYGMFTSFTEALDDLGGRLAAIEAAVRAGPPELASRVAGLEAAVGRLADLVGAQADGGDQDGDGSGGWVAGGGHGDTTETGDVLRRHLDALEQRTAALATGVESLLALLRSHVDDTSHSLGRRAGEVGRRLADDLGLWGRPKPPPGAP